MSDRSVGLVLSGGGARGAYEVGVLLYIADHMPELLRRIRVITGTSVGAVNAVYLASHGLTTEAVHSLAQTWRSLEIDRVLTLAPQNWVKMIGGASLRLFRRSIRSPTAGVFNVEPLERLVLTHTDWKALRRHTKDGRFDALAVATTDIASGNTHLFVQHADHVVPRWSKNDPRLEPKRVVLGPHHVLASAAIPLLFPPVRVQGRWYMDGGVRLNTPLSPALCLGAESLVIISVRTSAPEPSPLGRFPGLGQIFGKLLDALFLDRVSSDLDRISRINDLMAGIEGCGEEARACVKAALTASGRKMYRIVPFADVRPSADLGVIAAEQLRRHARNVRSVERYLWALFEDDAASTADAASFLFFDGRYAAVLIDIGRADAAAAHESLAAL